jgi:hypothetical protein
MVGRRALNTSPIIDESLPLLHPRRSTGDDNEEAEVTEVDEKGYHSSRLHFMSKDPQPKITILGSRQFQQLQITIIII